MLRHLLTFRTLYQLGFALIIVAALATQFIHGALAGGGLTLSYVGLFISYFTILSNILVAFVLCAEARADLLGKELSPRFERIRAFAVFCIITTGITYTFFLRGPGVQNALANSIPWIDSIFHHVMPLVMTFDWIAFPTKKPVRWVAIPLWLVLTAVYVLYVEVLGYFIHAYPYFFVDPVRLNGYAHVARASFGFIPFFLVFGVFVVITNRARLALTRRKRVH